VQAYRKFKFYYRDTAGNKPYSFRVLDGKGSVLQKTYSLVALPMQKFQVDNVGSYAIPVVPAPHPIGRPSSILDDILILGYRGSSLDLHSSLSSEGDVLEYSGFDKRIRRLKKF